MTINFEAACKDLFKTEKKWTTLLLLSVCFLIPVAGAIAVKGYLYRRYAGERAGIPAADFDFSDFVEHLVAGCWPVLTSGVATLVAMPVLLMPAILSQLLAPDSGAGMLIVFAGIVLSFIGFAFVAFLIMPIELRAGLTMDFMAGFSGRFLIDFLRKVGLSYLLWHTLLMMAMIPLMLVGYLALFVGVYVVAAWGAVASTHLLFQHYDLYLERGGTPIPVNPALLTVPAKPVPPAIPPQGPPPTMPG